MAEVRLDDEGRLPLPEAVRKELRWEAGQTVHLRVEGEHLLAQAASPTVSLKEEARRLVAAMRDVTREVVHKAAEVVKPAAEGIQPGARTAEFLGARPQVASSAYIAPGATLLGDVVVGEDSSVWPGAVLRGDVAGVRVGARTNVQDGAVLHVSPQLPCVVGNGVTIGHGAVVHACTIGDNSLVGIHAVVLDGAKVGARCLIAAGAVVPPDAEIPDGSMVMGVPAKFTRSLLPAEIERLHWHADAYVSLKNQYRAPTHTPPSVPAYPPPARPAPPSGGSLPRHHCPVAAGAITVDGTLDDPGWLGVPPLSGLVLSSGAGSPTLPTEVRVCRDDAHLYVAFSCADDDVWGSFENRDDPLYDEEVVEFFLCPSGDVRHYFEFEISPRNTVFDARVFNPTGDRTAMLVEREWNSAGLVTAVRVAGKLNERDSPDTGWIAEARVPFADLGLSGAPPPGTVWRVNFYRIERGRVTEFSAWSPTYRDPADFHVPSCFGELVF